MMRRVHASAGLFGFIVGTLMGVLVFGLPAKAAVGSALAGVGLYLVLVWAFEGLGE